MNRLGLTTTGVGAIMGWQKNSHNCTEMNTRAQCPLFQGYGVRKTCYQNKGVILS